MYRGVEDKLQTFLNFVTGRRLIVTCFATIALQTATSTHCGPGSVVGIATGYGLDSPGIESRWGEIFRTCPDRPWGPPSLLYNGYLVFPGGKERKGRDADPSPLLVPWSWKGRAIPLLLLWAARPVQSLSACTRLHFTLPSFTSTHRGSS